MTPSRLLKRAWFALPLLALAAFPQGCLYSPVVTNTAKAIYPVAADTVSLTYALPKGKEGTKKVVFQFQPIANSEENAQQKEDDAPDDGIKADFDTKALAPGVYYVLIFLDEDPNPIARLAFVKPSADAAVKADGAASGDAPASGEAPAADAPAAN